MREAPDVVDRTWDSPALATDKPPEVTHHPVHLDNHVGCAVGGNRGEFCEWRVVCFEAVEDKSGKVFACRRSADANEQGQLLQTALEREPGHAGQHMVLFKEGSVERDSEVLARVETTLDDGVSQTEVGLPFTAAGEALRMDLFGKRTDVRIGEDDDGLDRPVQDVHLSLCQGEHCKRLSNHAGNDFRPDILASIDCDGCMVVVVVGKRLCRRDEALEVERFADKTKHSKQSPMHCATRSLSRDAPSETSSRVGQPLPREDKKSRKKTQRRREDRLERQWEFRVTSSKRLLDAQLDGRREQPPCVVPELHLRFNVTAVLVDLRNVRRLRLLQKLKLKAPLMIIKR